MIYRVTVLWPKCEKMSGLSTSIVSISIVDVFAERPFAGNQLAIVHDASALSDAQMLDIAREMNFSETTFVTAHARQRATVRIFTPSGELPFAGHPTVGTAWELTRGAHDIVLDLKIGPVSVSFESGIGWMVPPDVNFGGSMDQKLAAQLISINEEDLAEQWPIEFAEVGPRFVMLPVRDLATLKSVRLNAELHKSLAASGGPPCVFVFTDQAYDESADFAARMFFEALGIREDPATGSANSAFAAYLRKHRGNIGDVVVDQGVEISRPSRLYLDVRDVLRVGGEVRSVMRGELSVESFA